MVSEYNTDVISYSNHRNESSQWFYTNEKIITNYQALCISENITYLHLVLWNKVSLSYTFKKQTILQKVIKKQNKHIIESIGSNQW